MERINLSGSPQSIAQSLTTSSTVCAAKEQPAERSMADNVMDRLNLRMTEIYGHRWTSAYTRAALDTWAKGLAGLTTEQIGRGVNACVAGAFAWPPTLPEFRTLCLTVPGLPSADDAADDALAIARRWKRPDQCMHPAVWHALDQIGGFHSIDEDVLRKRFLRNFERACADLADGKPLAAIPQPLPAPKDAQPDYTSEQAQAAKADALAKINAMFGRKVSA